MRDISWLLVLLGAQMSIFQLFVSVLEVTYALEFRHSYVPCCASVGTSFFPAITDYLDKAPKLAQNRPKDARTGQIRPNRPKQNTLLSNYKNTIYLVN